MTPIEALSIIDVAFPGQEETANALQVLIDGGYIGSIPGRYGRMAQDFIDAGLCVPPGGECGLSSLEG
jgi:hypothetical protein